MPGVNAADPKFIGAELRHRYALAAICSTGLLVPMGYEWGWRPPLFDVALRPVETPSDPLFDLTVRELSQVTILRHSASAPGA